MPLSILESIKQRVNYEKEIIPKKVPVIEDFELLSHPGTHNALTSDTSNNTYRITGENLKFDPTDPLQGIFFRRADEVEQKSLAVPWKMTDRFLETEGIAIAADNPSATPPVVNWPVTLIVRAKYTPNGTLREGIYSTPIVDYDSL
jgi:hypothetical protein